MDKSSSSSQSQKPSSGRQVRMTPSTPHPEAMTPPLPQSMVLPTICTSKPPETSDSKLYLEILKDAIGKFNPTEKMSEVFTQLANKFKEEEERPNPFPIGIPTDIAVQTETARNNPSPAANSAEHNQNLEPEKELEEEVELGEEGNSREEGGEGERRDEVDDPEEETVQEPVGDQSEEKELEVVDVGEDDKSDFEAEELDERARRRSLRTARKDQMVEVEGRLVESATKAVEDFQMAERKRKGKQAANPSQKRKPGQTSQGVVIKEHIEDLTVPPYS